VKNFHNTDYAQNIGKMKKATELRMIKWMQNR